MLNRECSPLRYTFCPYCTHDFAHLLVNSYCTGGFAPFTREFWLFTRKLWPFTREFGLFTREFSTFTREFVLYP
ncbi:hypothetical protein [Peribacillus frigoritolerans]|uniref:hypothetical protein n=1 Tax=Peribacillus frigoritolerans TaxID=450367 RepID=UPI00216271D5|nr:hypothetical protein [Peribacillus frigoritolerans]